ncbi:unnamed protein product, partial [Mesorhabditis spiculigera]
MLRLWFFLGLLLLAQASRPAPGLGMGKPCRIGGPACQQTLFCCTDPNVRNSVTGVCRHVLQKPGLRCGNNRG